MAARRAVPPALMIALAACGAYSPMKRNRGMSTSRAGPRAQRMVRRPRPADNAPPRGRPDGGVAATERRRPELDRDPDRPAARNPVAAGSAPDLPSAPVSEVRT